MQCPTKGPYRVLKVKTNGTVRIRRGNYNEIIHVRRLKPFRHRAHNFAKKTNQHKKTVKTESPGTCSNRKLKCPARFQQE